jgi:5'(3')-deoxyribonucleotidase
MQKVNHHLCYYITLDWRRDQEQFIFHHVKAIVSADFPLEDNPNNLKEHSTYVPASADTNQTNTKSNRPAVEEIKDQGA